MRRQPSFTGTASDAGIDDIAIRAMHDDATDGTHHAPAGNGSAGDDNRRNGAAAAVGDGSGRPGSAGPPGSRATASAAPSFRNRETELEQVLEDGLGNPDGQHFWLVLAPPQLGKSWFLHKIAEDVHQYEPGRWEVSRVDLRDWPADRSPDVHELSRTLFGSPGSGPVDPGATAKMLLDRGLRRLCQLDSAELADGMTMRTLREHFAQVHQRIEAAGRRDVGLALIVASRKDLGGIIPGPRLRRLPLSAFRVEVVREALEDLANEMRHRIDAADLGRLAEVVHRLSEGLPALLVRYLEWIRAARWVDLHLLPGQDCFERTGGSYVSQVLLSARSLLGRRGDLPDLERQAIELAISALAPYRLFTQSHLRYHAEHGELRDAMAALGWSVERTWNGTRRAAERRSPVTRRERTVRCRHAISAVLHSWLCPAGTCRAAPNRVLCIPALSGQWPRWRC